MSQDFNYSRIFMTKPVNILYMIDSLHYGGTELQLVQLIRNLDRNRFQPHICTLKPSNSLYDELDIPKLFLDFKGFNCVSLPRKILKLSRFIRTHRIQLIQTFFQDPFLLAAMVKPFYGVKLIGSLRDLGFWRTNSETRKMRIAYPFFSGFIANSQAVKDHFVSTDGIPVEKIRVIYNGFDCQNINSDFSQDHEKNENPIIGIVANLNRHVKKVEDFVKAAAIVHRQKPNAHFVIIGDGHLRSSLEKISVQFGIQNSIAFIGRVKNTEQYIKKFSVGVITSETEGFCNAIIEYMASGIPVVATNAGGNSELIKDLENGFLVPVGNYEALAKKILLLIDDKILCSKMGKNNKEKIKKEFDLSTMKEKYHKYYSELV